MKNSLETRLGLFFALVVIAALMLFEMIGGGGLFSRGHPVRAQFSSARDLKVGDPVKLAGVTVGRVKAIKLKSGKVEVSMSVDPDAEVHTDSLATVQFTGLMGQNFVALTFG
ncbi:MAG TPA: MlaD family protein, partial [Candidatus Limnocylindria bacterium]|nr:MlaD family protein [Candidatus Limnocylindria bacterium]